MGTLANRAAGLEVISRALMPLSPLLARTRRHKGKACRIAGQYMPRFDMGGPEDQADLPLLSLNDAWERLRLPEGASPLPSGLTGRIQKLPRIDRFFKPAGAASPRINPSSVRVPSETEEGAFVEVEAYEVVDRPWPHSERTRMLDEARHILSRTGFVPHCEQHFLCQRNGDWFILADRTNAVDLDWVEQEHEEVIFADPSRFDHLPEAIADAAGGSYGALAWAMNVLRRAKLWSRTQERVENEVTVGRLGRLIREGRDAEAAAHLAWLLASEFGRGWEDGAYFEGVRMSDMIAQHHRERSSAQHSSERSRVKQLRQRAVWEFVQREDPHGQLADLELARRAWRAHADADPIFEGLDDLLDPGDAENPREQAKEIAELRRRLRGYPQRRGSRASSAKVVSFPGRR